MPLYRANGRLVLFVHVPKAGGTSIEQLLRNAGALEALRSRRRVGGMLTTPQHMHAALYDKLIDKNIYDYGFAVVRHPMDRLLSEYYWRDHLRIQAPPIALETWVSWTLERYGRNPYVFDNHIRPQSEFISAKIELFKLEAGLDMPIEAALRALGLGVPAGERPRAKASRRRPVVLSAQSLERVHALYQRDYEVLGYDPAQLPAELEIDNAPPPPVPPRRPKPNRAVRLWRSIFSNKGLKKN